MESPFSIEVLVRTMKTQILSDIEDQHVPENVSTFSDLHDYVDANCYGRLCDDFFHDAMIENFGGRDADGGMPEAMLKVINAAQNEVDAWLREGRTA